MVIEKIPIKILKKYINPQFREHIDKASIYSR